MTNENCLQGIRCPACGQEDPSRSPPSSPALSPTMAATPSAITNGTTTAALNARSAASMESSKPSASRWTCRPIRQHERQPRLNGRERPCPHFHEGDRNRRGRLAGRPSGRPDPLGGPPQLRLRCSPWACSRAFTSSDKRRSVPLTLPPPPGPCPPDSGGAITLIDTLRPWAYPDRNSTSDCLRVRITQDAPRESRSDYHRLHQQISSTARTDTAPTCCLPKATLWPAPARKRNDPG